jgi:hypothetical protein
MDRTHLVKGLDFALLEKVRLAWPRGPAAPNHAGKTIVVGRGAGALVHTPLVQSRREAEGPLGATPKASLELQEKDAVADPAEAVQDSVRVCRGALLSPSPHRSRPDNPFQASCRTRIGRAIVRQLFEPVVREGPVELFQPGT